MVIYKNVLSIDFDFSAVGLGCWQFSGKDTWTSFNKRNAIETIESALEKGINLFDVAPTYGYGYAESLLGETIQRSGMREQVFIATKCGLVWDESGRIRNDLSKEAIVRQFDESLKRLKTDYIDLYQCHWPDPNTDIEETMEVMVFLKKIGKIKYIGFTNFSASETRRALRVGKVSAMQGLYNMVERNARSFQETPLSYMVEREYFPLCYEENMAFFPYSPLLQGLLSGEFENKKIGVKDVRCANPKLNGDHLITYLELTERLKELTKTIGRPLNQIALNYLIQKKEVTSVICGASNKDQLSSNLEAMDFIMSKEDIDQIDRIIKEFSMENGEIF